MRLIHSRHAQKNEHVERSKTNPPDWDNVRIFLAVARGGSFRTAAGHLGMTGHAVGYRVSQLERQLELTLFTRHRDGVRLTDDGHKMMAFAIAMEDASLGLVRGRGAFAAFQGEVRVAATEGLGTFWLTPRLIEFSRAHPKIVVDLHCSMQRPDELVSRAQADLAIQIEQPVPQDLIVRKIGRMHVMPCASKQYLDTYGTPKNIEDIAKNHRLAMQYADQGRGAEYYNKLFPGRQQSGFMALRTDASTAMYAAVISGLACGWLPTYYFAIGTNVVPLDIGEAIPFDIWLSYHPDAGKLPRVRRMIDWTVNVFNPASNPWFKDEFIHPKDFRIEEFEGTAGQTRIDTAFGKTS